MNFRNLYNKSRLFEALEPTFKTAAAFMDIDAHRDDYTYEGFKKWLSSDAAGIYKNKADKTPWSYVPFAYATLQQLRRTKEGREYVWLKKYNQILDEARKLRTEDEEAWKNNLRNAIPLAQHYVSGELLNKKIKISDFMNPKTGTKSRSPRASKDDISDFNFDLAEPLTYDGVVEDVLDNITDDLTKRDAAKELVLKVLNGVKDPKKIKDNQDKIVAVVKTKLGV